MSNRSVTCKHCGKLGRVLPRPSGLKWAHWRRADDQDHAFEPVQLRAPKEREQDERDDERVREMTEAGWSGVAIEDQRTGDADDGSVPADAF